MIIRLAADCVGHDSAPQVGFDCFAGAQGTGDVQGAYVRGPGGANALPLVMGEKLPMEPPPLTFCPDSLRIRV
jgi:hypothetical protein